MSADSKPSTSTDNDSLAKIRIEPELSTEELLSLTEIRKWIQNEAKFRGRTDSEFLLMYLRGCKFNVKKVKQKITKYYENRIKIPQWWTNRDINDGITKHLFQINRAVALIDKDPSQPTILLTIESRISEEVKDFDEYMKHHSLVMDITLRRRNSQMNGLVSINDCLNFPTEGIPHLLSPTFAMNFLNSFYFGLAAQIKTVVFLNTPTVIVAVYKIIKPFLSQKIKKRVFFYGSDWSELFNHVPRERLPEEYGGTDGSLKQHEDAFIAEVLSYADYITDDNKYGFKQHK